MAMRSDNVARVIVHPLAGGIDNINMVHVRAGGRAAREMESNLRGLASPQPHGRVYLEIAERHRRCGKDRGLVWIECDADFFLPA